MRCPFCRNEKTRVIDTRSVQKGRTVRRRRKCELCGAKFTTYEYMKQLPLMVIKRDGRKEAYTREKLISGITTACRKRPVSMAQIEEIVDSIEFDLLDDAEAEVSSKQLGNRVLERLSHIDLVSYVRFASVYRAFRDIDQFALELKNLKVNAKDSRNKTSSKRMGRK